MRTAEESRPAAQDDPHAWLEQHGDLLYRFALARAGDSHVAEDLVQETLLGAWRSREYFDGRSSLRTWLVGILRRKLADHFRREMRTSGTLAFSSLDDGAEGALAPQITSAEFRAEVEREEFRIALGDCLDKLPPSMAEPLARRLRDESPAEIAAGLGLTRSHLGVRLFRARLALRKCLERVWLGNRQPEEG